VWISGWNSLQHAANSAFLAVLYSGFMLSSRTAAVQCSGTVLLTYAILLYHR
jgi:hypothetical protein